MQWADFPQSLQDEIVVYGKRALEQGQFNDDHRPIKPVTLGNYLTRLRVLLSALVEDGVSASHFTSLQKVIDPDMLRRGLEARLGKRMLDDRARKDMHGMVVAALSIARYLKADDDQRNRLRKLEKKVRFTAAGMCEKNKKRLVPLLDPRIRRRLLNLPYVVAGELGGIREPTVRQAQRMQMAAGLGVLLQVPMRVRNLAELDFGKDIQPPIAGKIGKWRIAVAADDVKNNVAIDAELDDGLGRLLDRYVNVFRPVLLNGNATTRLFVGQSGTPKGSSALSKQLARFVRREVGVTIHAHLLRHLAAHLWLMAHPGDYETARRLLGHKNIQTTINFYHGLENDNAFARYDALLDRMRKDDGVEPPHREDRL
ncbi:tyrosine-type recombinase/integrase [Sphingosinicella microcystinivorans]|uniref:tyrosine-type recombinase/integrase n=1 Tax=Sphingosinicella microcystinivorans TaxID=335406 RepID=UPI0022F3B3A8|nr:tyrosine-type recombinase/integrase [Sphingosinicella microcystinivorans]WBX82984.1 tyrosine-type recombinase/integrase [Sphingosinicella microcystinivorans]